MVIAEAERMLRHVIGSDVDMVVTLSTAPAWILCDPAQLERVLLNLVINARDATPGGGELRVATAVRDHRWEFTREPGPEETGHAVVISVSDTGTGKTDEVRARPFEPFYTTRGPGRGTGLGLAVVDAFVRQTRGEIQVESVLGEGTAFHLRLADAARALSTEPPDLVPDRCRHARRWRVARAINSARLPKRPAAGAGRRREADYGADIARTK
jgi:two-component system, cell cycle sensor histidine kinase and response regulator CckA